MVWIVEKRVVYHIVGLGFERVKIPVRVKFEFEVKEGAFIPNSLSIQRIYNRTALERRYPNLNLASVENSIENTVRKEITAYLRECGFLDEGADPDAHP
ncbi:MAG: hypothetical protein JRF35_11075 [Deltaproteobacteria bacterium]|nr:hypothetical protein [Deltaproteobacteria bacterium]MBW2311595.1 hypothetical protein [Deltaproteobacteria bacterium]